MRVPRRTKKNRPYNSLLASLHQLPVKFRVDLNIVLSTYKTLNGMAPDYIKGLLFICILPRDSKKGNERERAFSYYASRLWNTLPPHYRSATPVNGFSQN